MSADAQEKPDAARIVAYCQAAFATRKVARRTALNAIRQIHDNLKDEFKLSDDELLPIVRFIAEL